MSEPAFPEGPRSKSDLEWLAALSTVLMWAQSQEPATLLALATLAVLLLAHAC
ncbi:hypothetical protein [Streptomyces erythrochromogenes]|uniref:hypothetical protein n=1 Tax=Streptomyces erythrochromogenes TaxID=285574 RepID=UPI00386C0C5D|nr:hypothetical protein OG364_23810 [Streptomyces erythrochromogenes]